MKKKELVLEVNQKFVPAKSEVKHGSNLIMFTPPINEDFWAYRVKLNETQAIVGFPKFGCIGVGFAQETDWNTNLPSSCDAEYIYNHIKCNKGFRSISKESCIQAIKMIQDYLILE